MRVAGAFRAGFEWVWSLEADYATQLTTPPSEPPRQLAPSPHCAVALDAHAAQRPRTSTSAPRGLHTRRAQPRQRRLQVERRVEVGDRAAVVADEVVVRVGPGS